MTDLLSTGSTWLHQQRHAHMSKTVTISYGGNSVSLSATVGRTIFKQLDAYGRLIRTESRDFLVRAADLVLGGSQAEPVSGMQITEDTYTYEVMAPAGEPVWRWADINRITRRIHTKQVG